jgi:hypothetical protein
MLIVGLIVCGVLGAMVSNWVVFPNYGEAVGTWGFIIGAAAFVCIRLTFDARQKNSN